MQHNSIHIPHQNGELVVSINENYEAVLNDYIGSAKILYLPASLSYIDEDGENVSYDVSPEIPDLSFGSCSSVEIIVCGLETHFRFGDFVFLHCKALHSIVLLSLHDKAETSVDMDEFSFAEESNLPKKMAKYKLFLGDVWEYYHHHELYLADPGDPAYDESTYAKADYLYCIFSFMDWLAEQLPALIMNEDCNPDLFICFVKKYGQYDFKEWRDRGGKTYLSFDSNDHPTLTSCVPQCDEKDWNHWVDERRRDEVAFWKNTVSKFFSDNSVCNDLLYVVENDEVIITGYIGVEKNLEIPSMLNGKTVTTIGHMAFSFNKHLETVLLPDSICSIEPGAFQGCEGLINMVIPKAVTCIRGDSFHDCTSLEWITLPDGFLEIQASAFQNCKHLARIPIPESVKTIGSMVFSGCSSLSSVYIPHGVTRIEDWLFSGCTQLSYVSLPDSVESIGIGAFADCNSLFSLRIPDSVMTIAGTAFKGCHNLTIKASPNSFAASFAQPIIPNPFLDCCFEPTSHQKDNITELDALRGLVKELELLAEENDDDKKE